MSVVLYGPQAGYRGGEMTKTFATYAHDRWREVYGTKNISRP